jgi:hypothetical protein
LLECPTDSPNTASKRKLMDPYAHLRTLYIAFKTATGAERGAARRALLLEGVRLGLSVVGLDDALLARRRKVN